MLFHSSYVLISVAFGLNERFAVAKPWSKPSRLRNRFNDNFSNGARQNTNTLTYLESPYGKKERDADLDFLPGNDDFSMISIIPSYDPSSLSRGEASNESSDESGDEPSDESSGEPSGEPSDGPSDVPINESSDGPSDEPSDEPIDEPSDEPSDEPNDEPSDEPSDLPIDGPSDEPSDVPIDRPSDEPSDVPIDGPSSEPSVFLPVVLSDVPTAVKSLEPTTSESIAPSLSLLPSISDSDGPSSSPSADPTTPPSESSSENPTSSFPTFSNFTDDIDENSLMPTSLVSFSPSSPPTWEDCLISQKERAAQIFALLDAAGNATEIRDLGTPQGLSADWLLNQDFRKECPNEKVVQRWVIAVFYFSTEGESWFKCSAAGSDPCGAEFPFDGERRFLSDFSECEWAGITCNDDDCVSEIEFEENGLVGTIPTELGLLTELAVLGMERGGLSSTIPSEIGTLTNLVFVDIDYNELTGTIPNEFSLLTNLQTLDLNDNFLEGDIELIGALGNLEFLQLQSNQFTGTIPVDVGNLTAMTTFNLHENLFTGTIPESICELRESNGGLLTSLIADCANNTSIGPDIECDCCSSCRD